MISKKPIIVANWKASSNIYKESEKKINLLIKNLNKEKSKIYDGFNYGLYYF